MKIVRRKSECGCGNWFLNRVELLSNTVRTLGVS
jgi:hypothetical protein